MYNQEQAKLAIIIINEGNILPLSLNSKEISHENNQCRIRWGSYPLQELDSKGFIVDDIGAEELGLGREFCEKIQKLQDLYDNLFLNNENELSYLGKEKPEEVKKIKDMYSDIFDELLDKLNDKFNFRVLELDIQIEIELVRDNPYKFYF